MKTTEEQIKALMNSPWRAQEDDLIGGWCVTAPADDARTPAEGAISLADFIWEDYAKHIASLHNHWLEGGLK